MLKNKDILIISNQSYRDRYWTSKQYITHELIKENRVLYVDGNYSFGKMVKSLMGEKWPITLFGKLNKLSDNLIIFTPPPRIPLRNHFRFVSKIHQYILLRSIKKNMKRIGMEKPIVWSFLHSTNDLVDKFDEEIFIYHCVDDWPILIPLAGMGLAKQVQKDENDLAERADVCFCTAAILKERLEKHNQHVHYIPNAVDTTLFAKALQKETKIPLDVATLTSPIIGFIGSLEKWVDVNLLYDLFSQKRDWTFISVGVIGKSDEVNQLKSLPNVQLLGLKPKEALPGYLKKMDIALIPFKISEFGKSISPLKLFEYFAAAKPVVAADLPEIARFSEYLWLAKNVEDYKRGIEEALVKKDENAHREKFKKLANENSWPERIKLYNAAIEKTLMKDS